MTAREEILARIRGATTDVTAPLGARGAAPTIAEASPGTARTVDLFAENVADYRARVLRVTPDAVASTAAEVLAEAGAARLVVPQGIPTEWLPEAGVEVVRDDGRPGLTAAELDHIPAVLTAAAVGIATTGTIVLDHGADQGRRALSLVPDLHVCVVDAGQVVHDVPDAVQRLSFEPGAARPLTWISGPSATSDIELDRVEGVHGPRTLVVLLVDADPS
jgi:L-lactate dehydrogenase complex protein LldG